MKCCFSFYSNNMHSGKKLFSTCLYAVFVLNLEILCTFVQNYYVDKIILGWVNYFNYGALIIC